MKNFGRTHLFKGCEPCDKEGLECVDDFASLKQGYWWKWKNESYKLLYEQFTNNLKHASFIPILRGNSSKANLSIIEYPSDHLPKPHKCPLEKSCIGGPNSSCAPGYKGPMCAVCSDGFYKLLQTCRECPTKRWIAGQLSILAAVAIIVIAVVIWTSKKKSKKSKERSSVDAILGKLKIIIGFYQVTFGVLEAFSYIKWPDSLAVIGKYSEVLQLNVLQIAPVNCLFPDLKVDAFGSLYSILALNAAAIIVAFAGYGLSKLILIRRSLTNRQEQLKKMSNSRETIYRNLFFFLYVTYLSTCSKTASVLPLACRKLCAEEKEENCQEYLKADYSIECSGTKYNRSLIVAYFAAFYVLLLPTASLVAIRKAQRAPNRIENRANDATCDTEDQSTELSRGLNFICENYNPRSWYWELVETFRKVVLTSGLILVGGESRAYIGLACVMSGLYGMLFAYKRPIRDPFENKLMLTSLAVTFVNLGIGAVSRIPREGIPSSIDPYVDSVMFKVLVIGANSLVIGLLIGKHFFFKFILCTDKCGHKRPFY